MIMNASRGKSSAVDATLQRSLTEALVLEVCARKAGNVHPLAMFEDCSWQDFVASAMVSAPILARAGDIGVGQAVLQSVIATQHVAQGNPNLGMLLLLAPLAAAGRPGRVNRVLETLTLDDAQAVYDAIALARPAD
jgi:triphosphoribosyl-dephospho-CoA synthase